MSSLQSDSADTSGNIKFKPILTPIASASLTSGIRTLDCPNFRSQNFSHVVPYNHANSPMKIPCLSHIRIDLVELISRRKPTLRVVCCCGLNSMSWFRHLICLLICALNKHGPRDNDVWFRFPFLEAFFIPVQRKYHAL